MTNPNIFSASFDYDDTDPPGFRSGMSRLNQARGVDEITVKLFELPPGESLCPYHYEYVEEWLIVIDGRATVRTPEGERMLERGDVVRFPAGPEGAHRVSGSGEAEDSPARVLMFSSAREPAVAVYPDSDKIGVWTPSGHDNVMLHRRDGHVGYWDGETGRADRVSPGSRA
jgi:uncharacterized cupin superfamily protein